MVSQEFKDAFFWKLGNELVNGMTRRVAVDTGDLKNSIDFHVIGNKIFFTMKKHWKYVEFGTAPHEIRVRNKKALSDGKTIFGKKVNHPGTSPQPFIRPTFHQDLSRAINSAIEFAKREAQI